MNGRETAGMFWWENPDSPPIPPADEKVYRMLVSITADLQAAGQGRMAAEMLRYLRDAKQRQQDAIEFNDEDTTFEWALSSVMKGKQGAIEQLLWSAYSNQPDTAED